MNAFNSDSKRNLKVCCNSRIELQQFGVAQEVFIKLTALCCMFLPHNHFQFPSTTRGTCVGPPVAVNVDYCRYPIFDH